MVVIAHRGVDTVFDGQRVTGWSDDLHARDNLASPRILGRVQPALSRSVDRRDPTDHIGWAGAGVWISLDRSRLLRVRHRNRIAPRVGDPQWVANKTDKRLMVFGLTPIELLYLGEDR